MADIDPNDFRTEPSFSSSPLPPVPATHRHPVVFTGSGSEYFRIWIVNLLLTIVTLGIYSAWAKVRSMQYFHRNTLIAESSFDYHATPGSILKGRLIALVLLVAYLGLSQAFGGAGSGMALLVAAAVAPWLLWRSLRFRLSVTSYRGLRFGFDGTLAQSYKTFLLWPILTLFTLYLLTPFTYRQVKAYQHNHSRYGNTTFSFDAKVRSFYALYGGWALAMLLLLVLPLLVGFISVIRLHLDPSQVTVLIAVGIIWFYAVLLATAPILIIKLRNLIWNHTRLGEHRIESKASVGGYLLLQLGNYVLILLTLGLFIPFARIRNVRYLANATALVVAGSLDSFVADQNTAAGGAAGAETAEIFGIDIAL